MLSINYVKVLLVTTLLSLVTMFDTVRNNSPDALELKCIEVGVLSLCFFVHMWRIYFNIGCGIAKGSGCTSC